MKTTIRSGLSAALLSLSMAAGLAGQAAAFETLGGCYNHILSSCGTAHPGEDMGDGGYSNCVNGGMNACDQDFSRDAAEGIDTVRAPNSPARMTVEQVDLRQSPARN